MSEFRINSGILQNDLSSLYIAKESLYIIKAEIAWQILKLKVVSDDSAVSRIKGNLALYSKKLGNEVSNINYIINSGNTVISKAKTAEASANLTMSGLLSIISITWPFNGSSYISNAVAAGKSAVASFGDMLEQGMYELKDVVTGTAEALFWTGKSLIGLKNDAESLLSDVVWDTASDIYDKLKIGSKLTKEDVISSMENSFYNDFSNNVSDSSLLFLMQLGTVGTIDSSTVNDHYNNNVKVWNGGVNSKAMDGDYIENQNELEDMQYGKYNSMLEDIFGCTNGKEGQDPTCKFNACEVIATYNCEVALNELDGSGMTKEFPEYLKEYETSSTVANGYSGTSPYEIQQHFKDEGYTADLYIGDNLSTSSYNNIQNSYDTFTVTVYNNGNDLSKQVHTMAITKTVDSTGKQVYQLHNSYNGGKCIEGNSINDVLNTYSNNSSNRDVEVISIIGVSNE